MDTFIEQFVKLGLAETKAKETAANKKLGPRLSSIIELARLGDSKISYEGTATIPLNWKVGALYYQLASTSSEKTTPYLEYIALAITSGKLLSSDQVSAAIKYADKLSKDSKSIVDAEFDDACGVGVVVTDEQIETIVASIVNENKKDLIEKRYSHVGPLLGKLKSNKDLQWANSATVKTVLDKLVLELIGPKDDRDTGKAKKQEKKKQVVTSSSSGNLSKSASTSSISNNNSQTIEELAKSNQFVFEGELSKLHKPGENPQINAELMKQHLLRTGGKVVTRFPPEPNGFLHIGHAKAININFGFAKAHNGITYLRYDDTNPAAEEEVYFTTILDTVKWLGYEPHKITYSSDHFQRLYDLAHILISKDKAYICECTPEQIYENRGGDAKGPRKACKCRSRPIEESTKMFTAMKEGKYKEGEIILRMKQDLDNPSPQFWDLIAYRVKHAPHHRTGADWVIYPTYDYTHCLCDSFEDITHSLCTTEFTLSRESYYWLVDALELYKPVQWEYGRLNIGYTVLSKRKLNKLVTDKYVDGWDDPRLFTLSGIRRRGYTPESINAFVRDLGVTTAVTTINPNRLENYIRSHLNETAPRYMVIVDPIKVTIKNLPADHFEEFEVPFKPKDERLGSRKIPFTNEVYIDKSDFKIEDDPNFFRLTLGKTVGLLNVPFPIKAIDVKKDSSGEIIEIIAEYVKEENGKPAKKPKAYIQWVSTTTKNGYKPTNLEIRLYSTLFLHENPQDERQVPEGWLTDLNPNSIEIKTNSIGESAMKLLKVEDKIQALRTCYLCVDKDTVNHKDGTIVLNRTATLKEDSKKDS